ncbi:MAG: PepSY-associated TM helix domain-containing protein [Arachidicoccus sp.]|nr:PepSY-associated TM helix domain-containing protein [Arachidicoccus sp.]
MINEKVAHEGIKKGKEYNFKKICNNIHLWLGIASAIVLFVVCLTGTIFVFHTEIEKLLYPKWFSAKSGAAKMQTPDALIEKVEKVTDGKVVSFIIPSSKDEVWLFSIKGKSKKNGSFDKLPKTSTDDKVRAEKNKVFYVNPYTGAITGIGKSPAGKFFVTIENIHRWFFIGKPAGKAVGGSAALIFILLIISGVVIWFPKKLKHWREGFKIKFSANWKRVNFDLHRAFGAYVFPVILLSAITGPSWSFEWYRSVTSKVLNKEVLKKEKALSLGDTVNAKALRATYTQILDTVESYIPANGTTLINIPGNKSSAVSIIKTHTGFCSLAAIDNIQINPYSGKVLKLSLFSDLSLGKKIATVFRAIHVGEIFGTLTKIIYFLACLLATSLPITGILIWLNKLKKPKRKNKAHSV